MKIKITYIIIAIILTSAVVIPSIKELKSNFVKSSVNLSSITIEHIIRLNYRDISSVTGQKMNLKKRLAFKAFQKNLSKNVKKKLIDKNAVIDFNQSYNDWEKNFNVGGFLLGAILGLIGVALVYIFSSDPNFRKSSLYGLGLWLIVITIMWLF